MKQHTPGPIRLHWRDGDLFTEAGVFVASSYAEDGTEGMHPDSPEAGLAPIIAAAPELLEALRKYEKWLTDDVIRSKPLTQTERYILDDARAVLAQVDA